ncbi:MAG: hypothetical protein H0W72_00845 [Planctomycetes bacterium]|nr:hypothetical protein [Planctomycetota bacterium]
MDSVKFALIVLGYVLLAPALGTVIAFRDTLRRPALMLMLLLTALPPGWFTLTAWSQDWYRGHARGYQGSIIEILALALLLAAILRRRPELRVALLLGLIWGFYCLLCSLSLLAPYEPMFARMALFKYIKLGLIPVAACVAVRDAGDVRAVLHAAAIGIGLNLVSATYQRYVLHLNRVHALFEHSNSMGMWSYMLGGVLLAAATTRTVATRTIGWWTGGALAGGALTIMSLARGSMLCCGAVYASIIMLGLAVRPSLRGAILTIGMLLAMALMLLKSIDSIQQRVALTSEQAGYEDIRPILLVQARAMSADHALGVGWNNYCIANSRPLGDKYSALLEQYAVDRGSTIYDEQFMRNPMVENIYWLHRAEVGWPGLIGYLLVLAVPLPFALVASIKHRKGLLGAVAAGFLITTVVLYVHGSLERVMVETKNLSAWLVLVGVVVRCATLPATRSAEEVPPSSLEPDAPLAIRGRIIP